MIDRAEQFLRQHGLSRRCACGTTRGIWPASKSRVAELPRLLRRDLRAPGDSCLQELGFKFVTLDLQGFRSGSLNVLVPVEHCGQLVCHQPAIGRIACTGDMHRPDSEDASDV